LWHVFCAGNGDVLPQPQQQQQQQQLAAATMPIKEQKGENESRTLVSACVSILPLEPRVVQLFRRFCNMPQSDGGRGKGASNPAHLLWKPHSNNLATNEQLILK